MSPLPPFFAFLRRFAPFGLVWLLVWALPASREPLRMQLQGMPLSSNFNPSASFPRWSEYASGERKFDAFAAVARDPMDLNARLWRLSQMIGGKAAGWDKTAGEQNHRVYSPQLLMREAEAIHDDFPQEKWLVCLPLLVMRPQFTQKQWSEATKAQFLALAQNAARVEPGNAFYALFEAYVWRRDHNPNAMWAALNRAATSKTFDSHDLDWARAIARAHDAARPLILEEKQALWRASQNGMIGIAVYWPQQLESEARRAQNRGDHRSAIQIGVILGRIGDLMQRGANTRAIAAWGDDWKVRARSLAYRPNPPNLRVKKPAYARSFSAYASAHGRPDVAALVQKWSARQKRINAAGIYSPNWRRPTPNLPKDAAARAQEWSNAGAMVGAHLIFVALCWLLVNAILWRGVGAPSSRKDRVLPALCMALLALWMALWSWRQFETLDATGWTRTKEKFYIAVASVSVVAFFGAPFLLAVWAAGATLWRSKTEFLRPARIETELRLTPRQTLILRSGPAIFCTASLVFTLVFWLLYLALVAYDVANFDLLAWLPDDGRRASWTLFLPTEALFVPLFYCLVLDFVGFLLWFNKWRYYAGQNSRPLTHGGLRGWKEMLGIYLVLGSAIYFGVALVGWPVRALASRELETKMVRGELPL